MHATPIAPFFFANKSAVKTLFYNSEKKNIYIFFLKSRNFYLEREPEPEWKSMAVSGVQTALTHLTNIN